jgi:hypothetical protein
MNISFIYYNLADWIFLQNFGEIAFRKPFFRS